MPLARLRWISFAHVESDECGGLNALLAAAPAAQPLCGRIAAMVSVADLADRPPRALGDGEALSLGRRSVTWIDAPHVPHGWENGFLDESDHRHPASAAISSPSPAPITRRSSSATSSAPARPSAAPWTTTPTPAAPAARSSASPASAPTTLACMHGSAWRGDSGALLRALADAFTAEN